MSTTKQIPSLQKLETAAITVMREAVAARELPVDAGRCAWLADVVRDAYVAGEDRMSAVWRSAAQEVLAAYQILLDRDDGLDILRDALTELQELVEGK